MRRTTASVRWKTAPRRLAALAIAGGVTLAVSLVAAPTGSAATCAPGITIQQTSVNQGSIAFHVTAQADQDFNCGSGAATIQVTANGRVIETGSVGAGGEFSQFYVDENVCDMDIVATITQAGATDSASFHSGYNAPRAPSAPELVATFHTAISARWNSNADGCHPVTSYYLSSGGLGAKGVSTTDTLATVTDLEPGTTFQMTVTATNGAGSSTSAASALATLPASAPQQPNGLEVVGTPTQDTINIDWTPPQDDGGKPITGYQVTWSPGGGSATIAATQYAVKGLTADTQYSISVVAVNAVGQSPAAQISARTAARSAPVTRPGAPTQLRASAIQASQASITWAPPASNGGGQITGYQVSVTGRSTASTTATSMNLTGLAADTAYAVSVVAVNSAGAGPAATVSFRTSSATTSKVPTAVVNLQITSMSATGATLAWSAPVNDGGSPITGYTIVNTSTGETRTAGPTVTQEEYILRPATTYAFTVTATNANGTSPAVSTSVTTDPAGGADHPSQRIPARVHSGAAWKAGVAHVVGSAKSSAGIPVTWKATGRWVQSSKAKVNGGLVYLTVTLKKGAPKVATVTIDARAAADAGHDPAHVSNVVHVKR